MITPLKTSRFCAVREKFLALLFAISLPSCWTVHYPENVRLKQAGPLPELGTALSQTGNSPDVLMILAFSGGGGRARPPSRTACSKFSTAPRSEAATRRAAC